jgi:hypothetical protein
MAYPIVDAPYGLKPINLIGGQVFSGSTRNIPIASGYNTNIFNGDIVTLVAGGTVAKSALAAETSPVAGLVGVFLGCSYTNPSTKQKVFAQYWPAGTVASDAVAVVCDDPDTLFKVVLVAGTTADDVASGLLPAYLGQTVVGSNVQFVQNAGSTTTGDSKVAVYTAAGATTSSLPARVVDVVPDTANSSGNFVELIIKFNFGYHSYYNATGI